MDITHPTEGNVGVADTVIYTHTVKLDLMGPAKYFSIITAFLLLIEDLKRLGFSWNSLI